MVNNMIKKGLFVLILVVVIAGSVFAQGGSREHKHAQFDVLIGINWGIGFSPNSVRIPFKVVGSDQIPKGHYAVVVDFGATFDFYLLNWLSFNTGLLFRQAGYLFLDNPKPKDDIEDTTDFADIATIPFALTIPLMAHVNIPRAEWLYIGAGVSFNIPVSGFLDDVMDFEAKGSFFVGIPIDIGFDFIKPGKGGSRLFFRITPEFHKLGTVVPISLVWQIWNFRIPGTR